MVEAGRRRTHTWSIAAPLPPLAGRNDTRILIDKEAPWRLWLTSYGSSQAAGLLFSLTGARKAETRGCRIQTRSSILLAHLVITGRRNPTGRESKNSAAPSARNMSTYNTEMSLRKLSSAAASEFCVEYIFFSRHRLVMCVCDQPSMPRMIF